MPDSSILDELPHLDDHDVALLYDIVSLAQQSRDRPYKALFQARETVLEQHGSNAEQNSKYLRFLLKAGGILTRDGTQNLVGRLRALLSSLGIQLVFGEGEEDGAHEEAQSPVELAQDELVELGRHRSPGSKRRASFNDSNLDTTWISGERLIDHAEQTYQRSSRRGLSDARRNGQRQVSSGKQRATSATRKVSPEHESRRQQGRVGRPTNHRQRARSVSTQGSVRIVRNHHGTLGQEAQERSSILNGYASESDAGEVLKPSHPHLQSPALQPEVAHLLYRPSDLELIADATAFHFSRTGRRCLHVWHDLAMRYRQTRITLDQVAINHDRHILLRQSLAQLRDSMSDKEFWEQQARRAGRARDLFLLTKAFTHWAQSASDEILRTSVARRHILRTRYFNAWRDITAVNELKCRRLVLQKWFRMWRAKAARKVLDTQKALAVHDERLVEQTYWKWFWSFCDRKAPLWKDARLKRVALGQLRDTYRDRALRNDMAQGALEYSSKRTTLRAFVTQSRSLQSLANSSEGHRRKALLRSSLKTWCQQSRLRPLKRQEIYTVDHRLVQKAFTLWHDRSEALRRASIINRQRLLRDTWTIWNDQLRLRSLQAKMDDRIVAQSLYKWALEERQRLFARVMDHRLKERFLRVLSNSHVTIQFQLNEAKAMHEQAQSRRLMRSAMLKFHVAERINEQHDRTAVEFRNSRDLRNVLELWKGNTGHARQLNRWAADARFYCLATSTLRRWKDATITVKKAKRRDAYAAVRRRGKLALVKKCLSTWRDKATRCQTLDFQAAESHRIRLQMLSRTAFVTWAEKTRQYTMQQEQAGNTFAQELCIEVMSLLRTKSSALQVQSRRAEVHAGEISDRSAAKMFKKLGDSLFMLRRQEETAIAWNDRKFNQHRRNMLRFWAYQTAERRARRVVRDPTSPSKTQSDLFSSLRLSSVQKPTSTTDQGNANHVPIDFDEESDSEMENMRRAEEWTQFDFLRNPMPTLVENPNSGQKPTATPLPGYMRTPSKRTARSRARFRNISIQPVSNAAAGFPARPLDFGSSVMSSTTPAPLIAGNVDNMEALTPQVTPFNRKMRAGGYGHESTTPATAPSALRNARFGQSRLGKSFGSGFDTGRTVRFGDTLAVGSGQVQTPAPHEKSS